MENVLDRDAMKVARTSAKILKRICRPPKIPGAGQMLAGLTNPSIPNFAVRVGGRSFEIFAWRAGQIRKTPSQRRRSEGR
jgi:hypothetical protein